MSGIYIPGVGVPKSCGTCFARKDVDVDVGIADGCDLLKIMIYNPKEQLDGCPLVSVPLYGWLGDDYDGLKVKYIVFKFSSGELVDDCFVLRPDKDKAAITALNAYADATENQVLASDIRKWLLTIIPADKERGMTIEEQKKKNPQTNYDCLISKTPEEMAEFLSHDIWHWECENCRKPRRHMIKDSDCTKCWLNWLVSIVKEN